MNKKGETNTILLGVIGVIAVIALIIGLNGRGSTGAVILDSTTTVHGGPIAALQVAVTDIQTNQQKAKADAIVREVYVAYSDGIFGNPGGDLSGVHIHAASARIESDNPLITIALDSKDGQYVQSQDLAGSAVGRLVFFKVHTSGGDAITQAHIHFAVSPVPVFVFFTNDGLVSFDGISTGQGLE